MTISPSTLTSKSLPMRIAIAPLPLMASAAVPTGEIVSVTVALCDVNARYQTQA